MSAKQKASSACALQFWTKLHPFMLRKDIIFLHYDEYAEIVSNVSS